MTTEHDSRRERCPSWCEGDHETTLARDETRHQSPAAWFPIVRLQRRKHSEGHRHRNAVAEDMGVLAVRYAGDRETWVAIATEDQQLELTPESAARLRDALSELMPRLVTHQSPGEGER